MLFVYLYPDDYKTARMIKLEICAESVHSCIEAEKGGATRIELCNNLAEGGTTPALSHIQLSRELIKIDLNVLIRPRGGDFLYSDIEFETMKRDIAHCAQAKIDGVVFGILDKKGNIDVARNKELVDIAKQYKMSTTFHRAIDRTTNIDNALEECIALGFDRILSSGGEKTALLGKDVLKDMIKKADGRITVMPGAGLDENNIAELIKHTGAQELHGTFRSRHIGGMQTINNSGKLGTFDEEYAYFCADATKIRAAILNAQKVITN